MWSTVWGSGIAPVRGEMPAPKRSERPSRIRIAKPAPVLDNGRYAVKRTVGDTVAVSADIFRDGHEKLKAVVRYKAPGGRRWLESELHALDAHLNGVRWAGEFTVETTGDVAVQHRGLDRPLGDLARRAAPQGRRRPRRGPLERDLRGRHASSSGRSSAARARRSKSIEYALERPQRRRRADAAEVRRRARPGALPLDGGGAGARGRDDARQADRRSRSTASRRASAPGTSCSRAPGAA